MLIDRREFLVSAAVAVIPTRMVAADERAFRRRIVTDGAPLVELGFGIGLTEARRTAALLGIDWATTIEAGASTLPIVSALPLRPDARPMLYSVCASAAAKERALHIWRRRGPTAAATAVEWHPSLDKFGAEQLNARLRAAGHTPVPEMWAGWMAVKVLAEALLRRSGLAPDVAPFVTLGFDGHKGMPLHFDSHDRHLRQPLYIVSPNGKLEGAIDPEQEEL